MTRPASLRSEMPETAAFIDAVREAFEKEYINSIIRAGMSGAGTFHASENGYEIGSRPAPGSFSIALDKMVLWP